jgi:hypothetical protein
MSIEYSRKVKLFGNVSLLIDFSASTAESLGEAHEARRPAEGHRPSFFPS